MVPAKWREGLWGPAREHERVGSRNLWRRVLELMFTGETLSRLKMDPIRRNRWKFGLFDDYAKLPEEEETWMLMVCVRVVP